MKRKERGPTAGRGRQFAQEQAPSLMLAFSKASATMRLIQGLHRASVPDCAELREMRSLSDEELEALRRQTGNLLTDLRAELRRREQV